MSLNRILHFGNTEVSYRFCPEEILYMEAENGVERTNVYLLNGNQYCLPSGVGKVGKKIDEVFLPYRDENVMGKMGRSLIVNIDYLCKLDKRNTIRLAADVGGIIIEKELPVSVAVWRDLSQLPDFSKETLRGYMERHYRRGYEEVTYGGGGGGFTGFMMTVYEPITRDESYYDIDDDHFMFLGV